jgi:tetratricopeptide (TPR) repeat protein
LYHLNKVEDVARMGLAEQYSFYANRAYLNFDQDQYEAALKDVDRALALHRTAELETARLRVMLALGEHDAVIRDGQRLSEGVIPSPLLQVGIWDVIGRAQFERGDADKAVATFTQAIDSAPDRAELHYLRGMARRRAGSPKEAADDLQAFIDRVPSPPATFWGDAGVTAGLNRDYPKGVAALSNAISFYPYEIDSIEELGYQQMKQNESRAARDAFRQAIDVYDEVIPQLEGESDPYREARLAIKKEQTKLDKAVGLQAYFSKTDYNLSSNEALLSIDGALPSQYGAELSWRPPRLGFRDERVFEAFGRCLGNFMPDSWEMNTESWQGGVGARYKPFAALNFNTSFERLFKIGDQAEDNWLWRNMMSMERGTRPVAYTSWWMAESLYGEVSYYLDDPERWIYYLDGRMGPSFPLGPRSMLTIPQVIGIVRYQSDDPTGIGTYSILGVGLKARLLEGEKTYAVERWYVDLFAHYTWGWFQDTPEGFDKRSFDGIIFGVNVVK